MNKAPVAQLDRVIGFEPIGREFESLRARHYQNQILIPTQKKIAKHIIKKVKQPELQQPVLFALAYADDSEQN